MATFRLPRLPPNWHEQPQLFERYWDEAMKKIEDNLNSLLTVPGLEAALATLQTQVDTIDARTSDSREFLDSAR
jgi:hypothetical protein